MEQPPYEPTFFDRWVYPALCLLVALAFLYILVVAWLLRDFSMA